jgi:hypothetical protein
MSFRSSLCLDTVCISSLRASLLEASAYLRLLVQKRGREREKQILGQAIWQPDGEG